MSGYIILLFAWFCIVKSDSLCMVYHWSNWTHWSTCDQDGLMSRQRECICDANHTVVQPWLCSGNINQWDHIQTSLCPLNYIPVDTQNLYLCRWKWDRWTPCTKLCDGGETSRSAVCVCPPGVKQECYGDWQDKETVRCNTHPCGMIKAHSKTYWMEQYYSHLMVLQQSNGSDITWPYPNPLFNCEQDDQNHPKSKLHLIDVLLEEVSNITVNFEWTLLAKEYAASVLNLENGYKPGEEGEIAINEAKELLSNCAGYNLTTLFAVYATKEKLSRLNNNIGGINTIDAKLNVSRPVTLSKVTLTPNNYKVLIGIVLTCILLILAILFIGWYKFRKNQQSAAADSVMDYDHFSTDDENEIVQNIPTTPTQLSVQAADNESSVEEN